MNDLIESLNLFIIKYSQRENIVYTIDYFIDEYLKYNNIQLSNEEKIEVLNKSNLRFNKKLLNVLQEYYRPIEELRKREEIIKKFIEWKYVFDKSTSFEYNDKMLAKIDKYEFATDEFIDYSSFSISLTERINKIVFKERINPTILTRIIDEDNIYSYFCYYKAAINFFLTNKIFYKQFIDNQFIDTHFNDITITDSPLSNETIDDINSIIKYKHFKYVGGNNSKAFFDLLVSTNNIKEIKLFLDKLIPKYKYTIPGVFHYPSFLINNIIAILRDDLMINSEFYDFSFNNFNYNINQFKNHQNIPRKKLLRYVKLLDDCYIDSNYFVKRFTKLNKTHKNILIHCPVNCLADYYVFDNFKNNKLSFNDIYVLCKSIKYADNSSIFYPFDIDGYHLDSFIICINKGNLDCHFSFVKVNDGKIKILDSFNHRADESKKEFIIDEKVIVKDDGIRDCISYRVVFVSYLKN